MTWQLACFVILGLALTAGFAWYERTHPSSKVLALVATLAALAALGRIAFAPLPNIKPTTDIVFLAGFVLGGAPGFAVGALAGLASNLVFGQGPWTPWQMAAWGLAGMLGAAYARATGRRLPKALTAAVCAAVGLVYGVILNLSMLSLNDGFPTVGQWVARFTTSLPFDLAHAAGNVVFFLLFGPALVRILDRYRARLTVRWTTAPAATALPTTTPELSP